MGEWTGCPHAAVTQFVHAVGKFLAERSHRGGNGVILVHCTHGGGGVGSGRWWWWWLTRVGGGGEHVERVPSVDPSA